MKAFAPLPLQPHDKEGPVFAQPWQAQAFALTVQLSAQGLFTWAEWAEALGAEIRAASQAGDADLGDTYYEHWMRALERLSLEKRLVSPETLDRRTDDWRRAYLNTPHGRPVELQVEKNNG